jgi:eukaryotic-like serine/threonine-protein kinase
LVVQVGEVLGGRYWLERPIGAGGMGEVLIARDQLLDRRVAVKMPSASTTRASERFHREARAAARLNHPNVVSVYDWGTTDDGLPFMVMELVDGQNLREMLRERRVLPPREVADIGAQIAEALATAHAQGVVHRDVKPSNVLVTESGAVKVTDFGISKSSDVVAEALTDPGAIVGTPGYLAPEQAAGLESDARTDVYALGVVLTELLNGTRDATIDMQASTELDQIVARARAEDPAQRYQRAGELRDALRAFVRELDAPVTATAVADSTATAAPLAAPVAALAPTAPHTPVPPSPAPVPARAVPARAVPAPTTPAVMSRREQRRQNRAARRALHLRATSQRRWRARHVALIVAAPLLAAAAGTFAYHQLTRPASVRVPSVVDSDIFTAADRLRRAGFEVDTTLAHDPRPAGIVLAQYPRRGIEAHEGSHVTLTISDVVATVPAVVGIPVDDAMAKLRQVGFSNITLSDDYRDDVDPGTVVRSTPAALVEASKSEPVTVAVARDPHVTVPNVVGVDQGAARTRLEQLGLVVAVKTTSSRTVANGLVTSVNPSVDRVVLRGSTVTLTVSSGPKLASVPYVVGWSADDAYSELDDAGLAVTVTTTPASNDDVGDVIAQDPPGGRAGEGSTVTITVGTRQNGKDH